MLSCTGETASALALILLGGLLGLFGIFTARHDPEQVTNYGLVTVLYVATGDLVYALYRLLLFSSCRQAGYYGPVYDLVSSVIVIIVVCIVGTLRERHRRRRHLPMIQGITGRVTALKTANTLALCVWNEQGTGLQFVLDPYAAVRWNTALESVLDGGETAEFARGEACATFVRTEDGIVIEAYNRHAPSLRTVAEFTDDQILELQNTVKTIIRPLAA